MLPRHGPQIRTLRTIQISVYQTLALYINKEKLAEKRERAGDGGGGGGSILIYLKNDLKFKIIKNLSVSDADNERVTVEIENMNSKNLLIRCCYRPQSGAIKGLNSYLVNVFLKRKTQKINLGL